MHQPIEQHMMCVDETIITVQSNVFAYSSQYAQLWQIFEVAAANTTAACLHST
jgi:hypothetical protein